MDLNNTLKEMQEKDDFIMRPMVDVCFVRLMEDPMVRKGFCAAIPSA